MSDPLKDAKFHADRIKNIHDRFEKDGYAQAQVHWKKLDEVMFSAKEWNELRTMRDIYLESQKLINEMAERRDSSVSL
ncbi:MAG: hypothetical protein PVG51_09645 [Desulfosarcina sp.]